ncbi:MAG: metalloregulator ArsR/SmtB family transcription factor [Gemmatimonadaceae bacterium]|nr:metalloregulator ArsR/SmtB family transcription factor [Gemmatimonadaceae bacterium]
MQDSLSQTLFALADPTRRALLARLRQGEASVTQLAEPFLGQMSLPGVTKHLKVLERAGLVSKGRDAQWRPCRLNPEPLREVASLLDEYRAYMEASLDRLETYLESLGDNASNDASSLPDTPTPHHPSNDHAKSDR